VRRGKSHRRRSGVHCDVRVRMVHYGPAVPVASRRGRDHRVRRQWRLQTRLPGVPHRSQRPQVSSKTSSATSARGTQRL